MTTRCRISRAFAFTRPAPLALLTLLLAVATALLLPALASAHLAVLRPSPSDPVTFFGHGGYSSDGSYPGHPIRAEVPAGSTVEQAYLYATYVGASLSSEDRMIDFDGTSVETTETPGEVVQLPSARADVTTQVATKVGGGGGITSFEIGAHSNHTASLEGVALVVIYSNPSSPLVSIAVLDGGASTTGDTAEVQFSSPLEPSAPGFEATMAIGDGFSYQSSGATHACGPETQDSMIDVDGQRMTSCAGGSDDGDSNNSYLITVGGIGDSTSDPSNPFTTNEGEEDELYDLVPFLTAGDTSLTIDTANPSGDDDLFLAIVKITAAASVGTGGETPPPPPSAPEAIAPPAIVAPSAGPSPSEGQPIEAEPGSFEGAESISYRWQRCTTSEASSCVDIAGAEGLSYMPGAGDVGDYLRVIATAQNTSGSNESASTMVGPIVAPGAAAAPLLTATAIAAPAVAPRTCLSARSEALHWRVPRGVRLKGSLAVSVNGKLYQRLPAHARTVTVSLAGRPRETVSVTVAGRSMRGRRYATTRTYLTCTPGGAHTLAYPFLHR